MLEAGRWLRERVVAVTVVVAAEAAIAAGVLVAAVWNWRSS